MHLNINNYLQVLNKQIHFREYISHAVQGPQNYDAYHPVRCNYKASHEIACEVIFSETLLVKLQSGHLVFDKRPC